VYPVKIEPVGYGRYAVARLIAPADVLEATRVRFERHTMQGLGAEL
jgi:hypothetical protein